MFGFTEFEVHKVKGGFVVRLVTGKTSTMVMESKVYKKKDSAYDAADRWWKRLSDSLAKGEILSPVRFAQGVC